MKSFILLNMIMLIAYNYIKIYSVFQMVSKHFDMAHKCIVRNGAIEEMKANLLGKFMDNYILFIKPMLYAHILVPVCLLGLLAVLFLIYAGVLWYRKRLEQIETPNVFRYVFISWVLVSPIFTVLYYMVIFQLITSKNTQPNFAEINESIDKLAYKFASLMFINAVGLIYVFVKCISYLAKDCFSHVQIKPIECKESFISFA